MFFDILLSPRLLSCRSCFCPVYTRRGEKLHRNKRHLRTPLRERSFSEHNLHQIVVYESIHFRSPSIYNLPSTTYNLPRRQNTLPAATHILYHNLRVWWNAPSNHASNQKRRLTGNTAILTIPRCGTTIRYYDTTPQCDTTMRHHEMAPRNGTIHHRTSLITPVPRRNITPRTG